MIVELKNYCFRGGGGERRVTDRAERWDSEREKKKRGPTGERQRRERRTEGRAKGGERGDKREEGDICTTRVDRNGEGDGGARGEIER